MTLPITDLKGVGPKIAAQLSRLGISSIEDVLLHLPLRYEDRSRITPIARLIVGKTAVIEGVVQSADIKMGKQRMLVCMISDATGTLMLRFFHFSPAQSRYLRAGTQLRCFGEVRQGYHCLELIHPEYQLINTVKPPLAQHLIPIYPSSEGLSQNLLRAIVEQVLRDYMPADCLPVELLKEFNLLSLPETLRFLHRPPAGMTAENLAMAIQTAQRRLAFEELLAQRLSLRLLREWMRQRPAPHLQNTGNLVKMLCAQLPFALTAAQQRVYAEIAEDLRAPYPMQRLLQGDVGSGKTLVALLSALNAIESGYQVAVMTPTELLSEQHFHTFNQWLQPLQLHVTWLTGSLTKKQRQQALNDIAAGATHVAIGTQALFQDSVTFAKLALVIVDEQHRFGVQQRLALRNKGAYANSYPHQLIMTATPIPRTLAMTAYADLEVSVIDELPPGRTPVTTSVMPNTRRREVIARLKLACQEGRQAYWVCPLIAESETLQLQAAEKAAIQLAEMLPELRIGLLHGRMPSKDKEQIMADFKQGQIHLLVATTVIEVGVDVPNASLMIIENAERLGLAQLHQLRGRVGRGTLSSYCVLLYQPPLTEMAHIRLATLRDTHDGFVIAQRDLELRGPGEVLGTRQTGTLDFRIVDIQRDQDLFKEVAKAAKILMEHYPETCQSLIKRWVKEGWHYGDI